MPKTSKNQIVILSGLPYADWPSTLKPGEVAILFRVDPKTVTRWAQAGKLSADRTLGNHKRFRRAEVYKAFYGEDPPESGDSANDAA
jgi:excisionase family DNA binding protein